MSDEVYGVWKEEMGPLNFGAVGTPQHPELDVTASVKVPDGLWVIFGKMVLENPSNTEPLVEIVLKGGLPKITQSCGLVPRVIQITPPFH